MLQTDSLFRSVYSGVLLLLTFPVSMMSRGKQSWRKMAGRRKRPEWGEACPVTYSGDTNPLVLCGLEDLWKPVRCGLSCGSPISRHTESLGHIHRRRMLGKVHWALTTRPGNWGWECLLQGCPKDPHMHCRRETVFDGNTGVMTLSKGCEETKFSRKLLCSFLLFSTAP